MKEKINSYFAILIITIMGSGAALIIIHVAYDNAFYYITTNSAANYTALYGKF